MIRIPPYQDGCLHPHAIRIPSYTMITTAICALQAETQPVFPISVIRALPYTITTTAIPSISTVGTLGYTMTITVICSISATQPYPVMIRTVIFTTIHQYMALISATGITSLALYTMISMAISVTCRSLHHSMTTTGLLTLG